MLVAEELVLLALDLDGTLARGMSNQPAVAVGVTGALVTELVQQGHVDVSDGRIVLTASQPSHPLLAQTLDNLAPYEGKKLKSKLGAVKHAGWNETVDAMVAAGIVGRDSRPARPTRHPIADTAAHAALLAEVREAATGGAALDDRMATLLALAGPSQLLEVVAPRRADRARARQRIKEASERVPAAGAVKHVIDAMHAAVAAGAMVATSAGAGSS
jgi:hypothetical protein